MIYMSAFWILILSAYFLDFAKTKRWIRAKWVKQAPIFIWVWAASFLVVSIVTKDPIFSQWGVPTEFEWVVGMGMTVFGCWKFYLDALAKMVHCHDKDIAVLRSELRSGFDLVEKEMGFVQRDLASVRKEVETVQKDLSSLRGGLTIVREKASP